jgi:hypothetical protein
MTFQITQSLRNSLVISFWEVLFLVALEIVLVTKNKFWWIHPWKTSLQYRLKSEASWSTTREDQLMKTLQSDQF